MLRTYIVMAGLVAMLLGYPGLSRTFADTITLSIQDTQLTAGSTGFVDIYLAGTGGATLGQFQFQLSIVGQGPGTDLVNFEILSPTELDEVTSNTQYIFSGASSGLSVAPDAGDPKNVLVNDVLGDQNLDFVSADGSFLLARLKVTHFGLLAGASRDFDFNLVTTMSIFDHDALLDNGNDYSDANISVNFGKLQVVATPEPASLGVMVVSLVTATRFVARRRRRTFSRSATDKTSLVRR